MRTAAAEAIAQQGDRRITIFSTENRRPKRSRAAISFYRALTFFE
jgi:hypothetical protein